MVESHNEKAEFPFQPVPAGVFRRAGMTTRSVGHLGWHARMTSLHDRSAGPVPTRSSRSDDGGWTDREPFPRILVGPGRRAWFGRCCALPSAIPVRPIRPRRLPFLPLVASSPPFPARLVVCHPSSLLSCARAGMVSSTCRSHDPGDVVLVHHSPEPFLGPARTMVFSPRGAVVCQMRSPSRAKRGVLPPTLVHRLPRGGSWGSLPFPSDRPWGERPRLRATRGERRRGRVVARLPRTDLRTDGRSGFPSRFPFSSSGSKGEWFGFEPGS